MTALPQLVDSHCHLDFPDFDGEMEAVIARAHAAGVARMVTICTKLPNLPAVRAITAAYPGVFYAAGVHPMSVADHAPFSLRPASPLCRHRRDRPRLPLHCRQRGDPTGQPANPYRSRAGNRPAADHPRPRGR